MAAQRAHPSVSANGKLLYAGIMGHPLEIRPATFEDLGDVAAIHVKVWQQAYIGQVPQVYLDNLDVAARKKKWEELFQGQTAEDKNLYLAIQNGTAVGFVSFGRSRDNAMQGEIYAMYVLQEAWGTGAGYALFKVATQSLHKAGYQVAHLWVLDSNERAIQSYKKWGGITDTALVKEADIGGRPLKEIAVSFQLVPT